MAIDEIRPPGYRRRSAPTVVFTWTGGGIDTVVTYALTDTGDGGCRLVLTHDGVSGAKGLFLGAMLRFGWRGYVTKDLPRIAEHLHRHGFTQPFPTPPKIDRVSQ